MEAHKVLLQSLYKKIILRFWTEMEKPGKKSLSQEKCGGGT